MESCEAGAYVAQESTGCCRNPHLRALRQEAGKATAPARSARGFPTSKIHEGGEDKEGPLTQYIRDDEGRLLRDKELISQNWARYFRSLLNSKSDGPDLGIAMRLPQQPAVYDLGIESTENEVAAALRGMGNSTAVGPWTCSNLGCTTTIPSSGTSID